MYYMVRMGQTSELQTAQQFYNNFNWLYLTCTKYIHFIDYLFTSSVNYNFISYLIGFIAFYLLFISKSALRILYSIHRRQLIEGSKG